MDSSGVYFKFEKIDETKTRVKINKQEPGINTNEILKNIPSSIMWFKIDDDNNLYQLGYGNKMRRLWTSETNYTKGISETISKNKDMTKKLLSDQGIVVPNGYIVNTIEEANKYFDIIISSGYNVTVKPLNANGGRGVTLNIKIKDDLYNAFNKAQESNKGGEDNVIIEQYIEGDTYRITLINKKFVACCKQTTKIIKNKIVGNSKDSLFLPSKELIKLY